MFKKISAVGLSCVTTLTLLLSLFGGSAVTAVTVDEMTTTAISCIMSHEGSYGSVNRNDCGALSIGKLQWHAGRALNLLKSVCNAAPSLSQSILGSTFYNEVLSASNWNSRTLTVSEGNAVSTLLTTDEGIAAQDALASSDVQGYIQSGQNKGLVNAGALIMYADIYNFGSGIASRIASRAAGYTGSYEAVTLDDMYKAAMNDNYGSNSAFVSRTNMVYQDLVNAGYGNSSVTTTEPTQTMPAETTEAPTQTDPADTTSDFSESYAGQYTVMASSLNLRSGASTSYAVVTEIPYGAEVTVTAANGEWAAVTYEGNTGYCSMMYLSAVIVTTEEPVTTTTEETTTITEETTTTTEETTTTTEETTTTTEETTTTPVATFTTTISVETNMAAGLAPTVYGDVDNDGEVTTLDAILLQKYIAGLVFFSHEQMVNADCVVDGVLNETDVAVILQHLIGRYTALPIC